VSDGLRIAPELFDRTLASTEASEALHQLDSWWCARAGRSVKQRHFGLSQAEFDVHMYLLYLGEVGNGGHSQFFLNPTGDHASEALEALGRLGLAELRGILERACAVFPGSSVPKGSDAREAVIDELTEAALLRWSALDKELYKVDQASWGHVLDYVARHRDEILVQERC
jgi:uncharacterized protein DUF4375